MSSLPLPAHHTKHIPLLDYSFLDRRFSLRQLDDGKSNGTALWLGAQCLSLYLADISMKLKASVKPNTRPRAVELGSGGVGDANFAGLCTQHQRALRRLVLSSLGWDVLATDVSDVVSTVLEENVSRNLANPTGDLGMINVRELDWTVPPSDWTWANLGGISSHPVSDGVDDIELLRPPFDLIVTSDTLYSESLCTPLLRSLHTLCTQSSRSTPKGLRTPPIYICVERRDSALIDRALSEARSDWGFAVERVSQKKVTKAMEKGGLRWNKEDWEGVELWRMALQ
ncbi:hypothetical protein NEOLEDRAFT_1162325 [Neolentinus lepideus HHB14362 ss-1]|uniref:Uncharacterized protein n=1 Tax=Neolentinus lepideus HHB14362 ss-1 TaxID=1314782 RepID=A0A165T8N9_9AGAM|nr:hypothetical protein NEOLEDRAFT_1162325 [Neolentinus lepideus HHB14362 ss-1]